jgi:CubicO group peptidase (beta-lactamase class C family)
MIIARRYSWRLRSAGLISLIVLPASLGFICSVGFSQTTAETPLQVAPQLRQSSPLLQGLFTGSLGPLHLQLHLAAAADGTLTGTLDSLDQNALGIPCTDFHIDGKRFSFTVPSVQGSWAGTIDSAGTTLTGTWTQGSPSQLTFTRIADTKPSVIDGYWLGTLKAGSQSLRIQITLQSDSAGRERCTLDSLDQGAFGLLCENVTLAAPELAFDVPSVKGHWSGKLSADGKSLAGQWTQGQPLPLEFLRENKPQTPPPPPPVTFDPAMPPVDAPGMKAVLDRDLAPALKEGDLAPHTGTGVTIGILRKGVRRVLSYGTAKPDSVFEIGSVTKTFTGLLLAQMIEQHQIRPDTPVRELLPEGTVTRPDGPEIQLLDLVTQHSGLPRMPDNFNPADPNNPYADYHAADLYRFIAQHGLAKPAAAPYLYSNFGFGLLGQALANRATVPYAQLLQDEITMPLGLTDTVVALGAAQQARFIPGHTPDHKAAHAWDLDAFAGAGAIRSTADDMLTYLEANLHPDRWTSKTSPTHAAQTLSKAIALSHEPRELVSPGMHIAFAWMIDDSTGTYWHNGATGGYSSFVFFNPREDYASVVLVNMTMGTKGSFADRLGQHIVQRFEGKPAVSLGVQ